MKNMTQNKVLLLVFLLLILSSGCEKENPIVPVYDGEFAIYFLKDSTLKIKDILDKDISRLELAEAPWLTANDIEFYDFSSHCIYLKKDKSYLFPNYYEGYYQLPKSWTDRPWIVVANNVACYQGYFVTDASIDVFPFPEISALEVGTWGYPKDIITSEWIFWFFHSDPRDNELVKEALIQSGLYHGGIEVTLDTTNSPIKVFNDDTTTVEYTLRFKNNDQDDLYIFDPAIVDKEIFHYHNNGPNLLNVNTGKSYSSQYMKTRKPDLWDNNWYTLLKSGESFTRTIRLKGYPFIPPGTYLIQSGYSVPRLEKNIRENQQGRYWLGQVLTNTLRITITNLDKDIKRKSN